MTKRKVLSLGTRNVIALAAAAALAGATEPEKQRMKVSQWLAEYCDSHTIFHADRIAAKFRDLTGEEPCWPVHTRAETERAVRASKSGGTLNPDLADSAYGYEIAAALAYKYANGFHSSKMGRGFLFNDCLDAIKRAGK